MHNPVKAVTSCHSVTDQLLERPEAKSAEITQKHAFLSVALIGARVAQSFINSHVLQYNVLHRQLVSTQSVPPNQSCQTRLRIHTSRCDFWAQCTPTHPAKARKTKWHSKSAILTSRCDI